MAENRPAAKVVTVIHKERLSKNILRLTVSGKELDQRFSWSTGCYVKLRIANSSSDDTKPKVRTYTVRYHDPTEKTISIDFAIHQPAGPATSWALDAEPGDSIELMGPSPLKMDLNTGDWYLFAADMAAIPAALSALESLPSETKGYALLEVTDAQDTPSLSSIPDGIEVQWLIHPHPEKQSDQQLEAIKKLRSLDGKVNIFVAGELGTIRKIKAYLNEESELSVASAYISSYWKIGAVDEEHKAAKRALAS